jgi:hypothetical protein
MGFPTTPSRYRIFQTQMGQINELIESMEKTILRPFRGNARKLAHQIEINGKN